MTPLEHIMGLMAPSYSEPVRRSMAQGILDKHAHELAEQLRQQCECGGMGTCYCLCADRIDPKAQRASTEGDNP